MTLQASGQISMADIWTEIFDPSSGNMNLNDVRVRHLAAKTTTNSPISFQDFYGKTYVWHDTGDWDWGGTYSLSSVVDFTTWGSDSFAEAEIWVREDGTVEHYTDNEKGLNSQSNLTNWYWNAPGNPHAGTDYFAKWEMVSGDTMGANAAQNTWVNLNTFELNIGYTQDGYGQKFGVCRVTIRNGTDAATEVSQDFQMNAQVI